MLTQNSTNLKSLLSNVFNNIYRFIRRQEWLYFWQLRYVILWFPIFLSVILGIGLAVSIINETWHISLAIMFLVPATILFLKYPYMGILLWLLIAPFVQVTPNAGYRAIFWIIHRTMIPTVLIALLLTNQLRITKDSKIRLGRIDLAIVVSLGIIIISVILSYSSPRAMLYNVYDRFFVAISAYWLIRFVDPSEDELRWLLPIAFIIVVIESFVGLTSWFAPQMLPDYWLSLQGHRTTGTFKSYPGFTVGSMTYGLLAFYGGTQARSMLPRLLYFTAFGLSALSLFISFSRGSWLAGLIVTMVLFVFYPLLMARMTAIMLVVMSVLAATLLAAQFEFADERLNDDETARTRLVIYASSWEMIKAKPFFGWGYGTYDLYDRQFYGRVANFSVGNKDFTSHNTFLTVLAERGTVGFFFYYFPVFWLFYLALRVWHRIPKDGFISRKLLVIFGSMLLFQIVMGNFTDNKTDNFIFSIWWMSIAFSVNVIEKYLEPADLSLPTWMLGTRKYS